MIHVDSWEVGCQNWTHGLEGIFLRRVVDVPMSCFWMDGTCGPGKFPCMDNSHYAASLAHVWGRRYVADEAFTAGPPRGGR